MGQLAQLDEATRDAAFRRYQLLRPHIEEGSALAPIARDVGVALRTAQRWVSRYRTSGLAGLTRSQRGDLGQRRVSSAELVKLVEGLALQRPPLSSRAIWREVRAVALTAGDRSPSRHTVWRIVKAMPRPLLSLGREGDKAYRDQYDIVYRREARAPNEIWQADHTPLDLVARRTDGREGRPWLTVISDDFSRAITGFAFSFDAPSSIRTALALRQAIWRKTEPHWQCCGIPDALYTDNGSDFTSKHIEQVAVDVKIRLLHSIPGRPRGRGKIERLFRSVNQLFLCHLPGYRKGGRRRSGELLSLEDLDQKFRDFIRQYHAEPHSQTKQPPLIRWRQGAFLPRMPESLEELDLLLLTVPRSRVIRSDGIHFAGQRYMDAVLGAYVGESVIVRYDPRDIAEIRLFHQGRFLCRAIAPELAGEVIPLKDIVGARNRQRRALRKELKDREAVVDQLLELRQGRSRAARGGESSPLATSPARPKLKRYRND